MGCCGADLGDDARQWTETTVPSTSFAACWRRPAAFTSLVSIAARLSQKVIDMTTPIFGIDEHGTAFQPLDAFDLHHGLAERFDRVAILFRRHFGYRATLANMPQP